MTYQHILVPIDGSETSLAAVNEAAKLAKALNSKITVVEVMALDPIIADAYVKLGQTNELIERTRSYILKNRKIWLAGRQACGDHCGSNA